MKAEPVSAVMDHHTVAVHFFRLLTDYAAQRGLSAERLLAHVDIQLESLTDPNGRVPFTQFNQLCTAAADMLKEPCLGLKLGQSIRPGHLGSHGFALMSCATGAELIRQHTRYSALAFDAGHSVFEMRGKEIVRYWRSNLVNGAALGRLQDELNQSIVATMARWFSNRPDLNPNWVSFKHPRPADVREYETLFRCPLKFDAAETGFAFDASYVNLPMPQANPQLRRIMDDLCAQLLKQLGDALEPPWLAIARRAVLEAFKQGEPETALIAKAVGMSEAVFKEQLSSRGLSFRSFIDDLRRALAMGYMRDPALTLVDIAYLLGFSEQSAFQRAFKRWTGMTPGDYRRRPQTETAI